MVRALALHCSKAVLNGIQVGGVWGQVQQHCPRTLNQLTSLLRFVENSVVHHHNAPGIEVSTQLFFEPLVEDSSRARACE